MGLVQKRNLFMKKLCHSKHKEGKAYKLRQTYNAYSIILLSMRKVILSIFLSLDGSFEGPNKELDWHVWEMEKYMSDFLNNVDAILLGRVAYQLLADYWPVAIPKATMPRNPGEEHPHIIEPDE